MCGVGLICFQFGLYLAGMLARAGEPYWNTGEYVANVLYSAAFLGGLFFIPFGCIFAAVWTRWTPSPARAIAGKTLVIYAASTLLPVALCSFARAL
jgi:hypothetical protein